MISAAEVVSRPLVFWRGGSVREVTRVPRLSRFVVSNGTIHSTDRSKLGRGVLIASMSDATQSGASQMKAVNVVIKGTVQGVFYRKWTVDAAQKLGLNGWVRNCRDGSVEAVFAGPPGAVDSMIQQCYSGPSSARVSSVNVSQWDNEVPQGFEKKPTW